MALTSPIPTGRKVQAQGAKRWTRRGFVGMTPDQLAGVIKSAESGRLEDWADLCAFMLRTDGHLRAVYETRLFAVTSARLEIKPGRARPGQEAIAERAADAFREEVERYRGLESLIHHLAHAEGVGYANAQHVWARELGPDGVDVWRSSPVPTPMRDVEFDENWTQKVRTWSARGGYEWLRVADDPYRYIVHVPTKLDTPNMAGDLMAVAWLWLFKRWARVFMQTGMERHASPFMYGETPANSTDTVRDRLMTGLQELNSEQVAVFEAGTQIKLVEASKSPGDVWASAIKNLDDEMTKALLGATDSVDADGGSRARAEVQVTTGTLPRFQAIGKRIAGTIERDWAAPFCKFNTHLTGGATAPTPVVEFQFILDERPEVDDLAVTAGAVTVDELRKARGLEEWGNEAGAAVARKPEQASPFNAPSALPFPEPQAPAQPQVPAGGDIQSASLNGAQVEALQGIVQSVADGAIPRATGVAMIVAAFPISQAQAEQIMGSVGQGFEPAAKGAEALTSHGPLSRRLQRVHDLRMKWERRRALTARLTSQTSGASVPMTSRVPFEK